MLERYKTRALYPIGWRAIALAVVLNLLLVAGRGLYHWTGIYIGDLAAVWLYLVAFIILGPPLSSLAAQLIFPALAATDGADRLAKIETCPDPDLIAQQSANCVPSTVPQIFEHQVSCPHLANRQEPCGCPDEIRQARYRAIVSLWDSATTSPAYNKRAWNSISEQLLALRVV